MLRVVVVVVAYLVTFVSQAQNEANLETNFKRNVTITVPNVISDQGKVYFALYDSEENFNQRKAIAAEMSTIESGKAAVIFKDLDPNFYAVVCFHDANDNQRMDFEENGMPLEDYGSTNNIRTFGPPSYSDSKFELKDKDLTFEIKF